jgi:hypothetical protein
MGPSTSNHSTVKCSLGSSSNTMSTKRHPPPRSKSDNSNIKRALPFQGKNPPSRGRSFSPPRVEERKKNPPSRSQRGRTPNRPGNIHDVPMIRSGHSRSKGPPVNRSTHSNRRGHSKSPVMTPSAHSRNGCSVDNRSVHSRSGHTTIYNSRHSRNGDFDRSTHSMTSRSGRSRASIGSHPSLSDQRRGKSRGQKRPFPWSTCCSYFVPILVLTGAAIGLLFVTGNQSNVSSKPSNGSKSVMSNPPVEDPFHGKKSIPQWPANGAGLKVKIVNTLDESWSETFDMVVEDWEYGNPDAVAISVQKADAESECQPTEGSITVCSGDYGYTSWRGQTHLQLDESGNIASATIKLNEAYLSSMSKNLYQYTLCHEIGKFHDVNAGIWRSI